MKVPAHLKLSPAGVQPWALPGREGPAWEERAFASGRHLACVSWACPFLGHQPPQQHLRRQLRLARMDQALFFARAEAEVKIRRLPPNISVRYSMELRKHWLR